jgi:hypothetical protein
MTVIVLDRARVADDAGWVTGERQERPDPVPAARRPDPPPNRRPGHRHQRPLTYGSGWHNGAGDTIRR